MSGLGASRDLGARLRRGVAAIAPSLSLLVLLLSLLSLLSLLAACGGGSELPVVDATGGSAHTATAAALASSASLGARIAFYVLSAMVLVGAVLTITRKNAVTAVMSLVGTFFGLAALYTLLSAHFIAAIQVLVYAGAIMTLFVFVVMLLNREEVQRLSHRGVLMRAVGLGFVVAMMVFIGLLLQRSGTDRMVFPLEQPVEMLTSRIQIVVGADVRDGASPVSRVVGHVAPSLDPLAVSGRTAEFYRVEYQPGRNGFVPKSASRPLEGWGGVASVGEVLFADYLFPFEAISLLLLIAVIGAVVVARIPRRRAFEAGDIAPELSATSPLPADAAPPTPAAAPATPDRGHA